MGDLVFTGLAVMTIISAFWVVVSTNLVRSAVALLFTLFGLVGFYIFFICRFYCSSTSDHLCWWNFGANYFWCDGNK